GVTWTGEISGSVGYTYANVGLEMESISVAGVSTSFTYDRDGLLATAGALLLGRDTGGNDNGTLRELTLGNVTTTLDYNPYGELSSLTSSGPNSFSYGLSFTHDAGGRIATKT